MAQQIGADVRVVEFEYNQPIGDFDRIAKGLPSPFLLSHFAAGLFTFTHSEAHEFKPHLITAVQCETPSGDHNHSCCRHKQRTCILKWVEDI